MKKWVLKATIQKIISWLPGSHRINFWFQRNITKGVQLSDQYFDDKLQHAFDHLRFAKKHNIKPGFSSLEIGSGWYPVVPICFYLAGAGRIISIDLNDLMSTQGIKETIQKFKAYQKTGRLKRFEPYFTTERLGELMALDQSTLNRESLLIALGIELVVGDARKMDLKSNSLDIINSNNVFEHIYPAILKDILVEFKRVLKPDGIMSHFIDMSDHFAHLDQSISIYNFLRFSNKAWHRIDNSVQPQNRCRLSDYEALYADLDISISEKEIREGSIKEVKATNLAEEYKGYSLEDLATSHAHIVSTNA